MEAARLAVANFTSKRGHTTEVHETVLPAVTRETVKPTRHEIHTEAIDREVHQHHYHTTVQPLAHTETLPTKHTHNLIPVKRVDFEHDDVEHTKARVAAELAVFKNHSMTMPVVHTTATAPAVVGEHFHHHVHETVQPIIFKETHMPEVVHTTIPIHEKHHKEPIHHGVSQLALKEMAEFTKLGGILTGTKTPTHERYEGAPRSYLPELTTTTEKLGFGSANVPARKSSLPRQQQTTSTTTSTSTTTKIHHRPTPIETTPARVSMGDERSPISSSSSTSSPSMPSTPTNHKFTDNVPIQRNSEGYSQPSSPQFLNQDPNAKNANGGFLGRIRSHGRKSLDRSVQ